MKKILITIVMLCFNAVITFMLFGVNPDDSSQPSGNTGERTGCGIIIETDK